MGPGESGLSIDELLYRAVRAINRGDRATASALAGQVLSVDRGNPDAEDLLAASTSPGEIRRLTLMFVDLVDSTVLSTRVEPETYRALVGRYREEVVRLVNHYEGHISSTKGDGLLVMFGHPKAHEDDALRAVTAGLDITRAVGRLGERAQRRFGLALNVRVGVHRGVIYLDPAEDDVYGFAANLVQRIQSLAEPGSVAVSDAVAALVHNAFELAACSPARVKGVEEPVSFHRVLAERSQAPSLRPVPLVGREQERAWLQQAWQETRQGRATRSGVAFHGEPGIGKTRLAQAAAELVEDTGGAVVELSGSPLHADTGLYPVRRLLERRCGITRFTDSAERLRLLEAELEARALDPASTVPLLAPILGVGPEHGYHPAAAEGRTLYESIGAAAQRYVSACLGGRAGLVIAEDVHWFDPSTIELLNSILSSAEGQLMVVLTGRDGSWLEIDWPIIYFELRAFSEEESDTLIDTLNPTVSDAQRAAVRRRCDGIPFYIEHVVAGLNESGRDEQVPEALYEPLLARLHTRRDVVPVVEAAAVIGRSGDLALLRSVSTSEAEIDPVVDQLVQARVFEPTRDDRWQFRHELLRELALELAPPSLQRELHARVAHALVHGADGAEPDWRVVARHYDIAERFDDAVAAYRKACVDARRRGAAMEAYGYLTNALDRLARCEPGPRRDRTEIAIRLERGFLIGAAHGSMSGEGPADFEQCLQMTASGGYDDELYATLTALLSYYVPRADLRRAHALLDSMGDRITRDRPWSHAAIQSSLGSVTWLEGDFTTARGQLSQALDCLTAVQPRDPDTAWWGNTDPISGALTYLAVTDVLGGERDQARAKLAASVRHCESLGFPLNAFNRAHTYFTQVWVAMEAGQLGEAAVLAVEMRRFTEESGLDLWRMVAAAQHNTVKGLTALGAGADPDTLTVRAQKIARFVDGSRMMQLNVYLTYHDGVVGRLLCAAGRHDQARERLDMSLRHAKDTGMRFNDAELTRVRAHTLTDVQARRDTLAAALDLARSQAAPLFEIRCLLDAFDIDGQAVRPELADAVCRFPGDTRWPEVARAEQILA
ncbi:adenylate/guanylate cyclase domain-containing protein [Mycolicibacterium sp. XJ1904]